MNRGAGVFFYSVSTCRYLYLLRQDSKNWSIPGGKVDSDETLLDGLRRECLEEMSWWSDESKLVPIQKFENFNFEYHTFFCAVEQEFIPRLNNEHCGWAWVGEDQVPKPLHPGLFNTVNIDVVRQKLELLTQRTTS